MIFITELDKVVDSKTKSCTVILICVNEKRNLQCTRCHTSDIKWHYQFLWLILDFNEFRKLYGERCPYITCTAWVSIVCLSILQIDYFNNKPICDLVEKPRQGIMAVLDDACFGVGNVTDQVCQPTLMSKCSSSFRYFEELWLPVQKWDNSFHILSYHQWD